jgi:hypothetical protein
LLLLLLLLLLLVGSGYVATAGYEINGHVTSDPLFAQDVFGRIKINQLA